MRTRYGTSLASIIHPTDFSHGSDIAFAHALRLTLGCNGQLEILHVDRDHHRPDWDSYPSVRETLSDWGMLPENSKRRDVAALGVDIAKSACSGSDAAAAVLGHIEQRGADLVVLATHQREGIDRWMHGSLAQNVSNRTSASTLFIPYNVDGFVDEATGSVSLKSVVIPIDRHPEAQVAVDFVADVIKALATEPVAVHLLHIGDPEDLPGPTLPTAEHARWIWETRSGSVVSSIINYATEQNADLIAMATHGHDGFLDAIRGSTTEQVLRECHCPLLAVHNND